MPGKMTKSILRPPFRPPQVPAAVRSSRLSCGKVGKAQIFTSARESSGESRIKRGHEVAAHGWRWQSHAGMNEAEERQTIRRTVSAIELATGVKPVGWHTRSATSPNTRRLLVEEGFLYDSDAYNDDLPYFVVVGGARDLVLPYSFDTNDMHYQHTQRFQGADFADYVIAAYEWLVREGATAPKMMSIGLHLRMIGRPALAVSLSFGSVSIECAAEVAIAAHGVLETIAVNPDCDAAVIAAFGDPGLSLSRAPEEFAFDCPSRSILG
jgi:Polysaccharide deacetylase